jgi:hypothetical protein
MRPLLQNFGHAFRSLASSVNGSGKWSWALGVSKDSDKNLHKSSPSTGNAFQRLPEYPLGHMSAANPAKPRDLENEIRDLDLGGEVSNLHDR